MQNMNEIVEIAVAYVKDDLGWQHPLPLQYGRDSDGWHYVLMHVAGDFRFTMVLNPGGQVVGDADDPSWIREQVDEDRIITLNEA